MVITLKEKLRRKKEKYDSSKKKGICVYCHKRKTTGGTFNKKKMRVSCDVCRMQKWHPNYMPRDPDIDKIVKMYGKDKIIEKIEEKPDIDVIE